MSRSLTYVKVVSGSAEPHLEEDTTKTYLEEDTTRTQCRDRERVEGLVWRMPGAKTQLSVCQEGRRGEVGQYDYKN